ncbi:MAG: triose-phosphate isomerase [Flavobacteriales bacterium]|nr:triose-phosphate isomerase [Flavobacteriales bacterium]
MRAVWAIGTGLTASPEQAQRCVCSLSVPELRGFIGDAADDVPILLRWFMQPGNASGLFVSNDVNGGSNGGAVHLLRRSSRNWCVSHRR